MGGNSRFSLSRSHVVLHYTSSWAASLSISVSLARVLNHDVTTDSSISPDNTYTCYTMHYTTRNTACCTTCYTTCNTACYTTCCTTCDTACCTTTCYHSMLHSVLHYMSHNVLHSLPTSLNKAKYGSWANLLQQSWRLYPSSTAFTWSDPLIDNRKPYNISSSYPYMVNMCYMYTSHITCLSSLSLPDNLYRQNPDIKWLPSSLFIRRLGTAPSIRRYTGTSSPLPYSIAMTTCEEFYMS